MRRTMIRTAVPLATASLLLVGVGLAAPSSANMPSTADGDLVHYAAVAPNTEVLPVGAWARVRAIETGSGKTVVTLQVRGLAVNATYGAHAHYKPCGSTAAAAGAHYQNLEERPGDEVTPSTTAGYANSANEVWLDFTTDDEGNGSAQTVVGWQFRPSPYASGNRSVIIHRELTSQGGTPPAGNAGPRLGCISVPF